MAEPTRPQPMTTTCTNDSRAIRVAPAPSARAVPGREATPGSGPGGRRDGELPLTGGARRPDAAPASATSVPSPPCPACPTSDNSRSGSSSAAPCAATAWASRCCPSGYALPIFASDPLSSVAYATQEILIVLTLAGTAFLYLAPWLAVGVVFLLVTVVLSYRQVVHAYPSGGGDYEVAMKNHGQFAGARRRQRPAGRLRDDRGGVGVGRHRQHHLGVPVAERVPRADRRGPGGRCWPRPTCAGVRESGKAFAVPTYLFISGIVVMIVTGLIRYFFTDAGLVSRDGAVHGHPGAGLRAAGRPRAAVLRAARVRLRLHRADRRRGDRQRRAGVQAAEEPERRHHAGADGRHRGRRCSPA